MIKNERALRHELVVEAAHRMMMAARTAPKGKGIDVIEIVLVDDRADLEKLSEAMRKKSEASGMKFLLRDADNILQGDALLLSSGYQLAQINSTLDALLQAATKLQSGELELFSYHINEPLICRYFKLVQKGDPFGIESTEDFHYFIIHKLEFFGIFYTNLTLLKMFQTYCCQRFLKFKFFQFAFISILIDLS